MLIRRSPLFNTATDAGQSGGGGTPAITPSAPAFTTPPDAATKPGVIDGAIAMFKDKSAMVAEISTLKKSNGDLTAEVARLKTELTTVTTERDKLQSDFTRLETALKQAQAEKTTVMTEVTHQLASAGVPESGLPKGAPAPVVETSGDDKLTALNKRIAETTDSREKGRLANEAWDLMSKEKGTVRFALN